MRIAFAALLAVIAASMAGQARAAADPYAWCAIYSGDLGGVRSCYFHTLEQCRATVSGAGGYCSPNPWFTGSTADGTARRARPRS